MLGDNYQNFISLISLSLIIISTLCWLVTRTLKEGKQALEEIKRDSKISKET